VLRARVPTLYALWHSGLLPLVSTHRGHGVVVLVSRHQDGELITRVIERFGFRTARGSSTRGGGRGALEMLRGAGAGASLAITPDGPRGPAQVVKPGLVFLASRSGLPVRAVGVAAMPAWTLRSWDGFQVPKPFARVAIAHGDPIPVPSGVDDASAGPWCERIGHALRDVNARACARLEGAA